MSKIVVNGFWSSLTISAKSSLMFGKFLNTLPVFQKKDKTIEKDVQKIGQVHEH